MRLFAALDLSDDAREALAEWWLEASAYLEVTDWRDVPSRNWHLTLAFFGDVDGGDVAELADTLADCAANAGPLHLKLQGIGVFPGPERPRVFWAGVEEMGEANELKGLVRCCRHAGHATLRKREDRRGRGKESPFRGHVTLARAREPFAPMNFNILRRLPPLPEVEWQVETLGLYQSILNPEGARYHLLEEFELNI